MASRRQIWVGGVPIGGGAPVAVQTMTKTETADYDATMRQIRGAAEAGADLVRCAIPRDLPKCISIRSAGQSCGPTAPISPPKLSVN